MLVKEVMTTDVVVLDVFMSLREAVALLAEKDISGAPVVDNNGELVGILTEKDILREVKEAADQVHMVFPSVHSMGIMFELTKGETEILEAFKEQANVVVMDVMTRNVITCTEDTTVNEVASILIKRDINRLPVVDEDNHVVGIITRGDIVRSMSENSG